LSGYIRLPDFSQHTQVLVFTCHPETKDAILAADPATAVLELAPVEPVAQPAQPVISQRLLEIASDGLLNADMAIDSVNEATEAILRALDLRPMALSEIVELTGLEEMRVTAVLKQLRSVGKVDVAGRARGARWQRVRVAREPAVE
jgi:DNA-binding transcriptional ArsR family regulator